MADEEDDAQDDNGSGWGTRDRDLDRRHRLANDAMLRQGLDGIRQTQRELKRDLDKLREVVGKDVESGTERTFMIRRIEERLNELFARFSLVESNYVRREDHEKALAPFRKWGSWIAMLVIGAVVTAVMGLVLVKGGAH